MLFIVSLATFLNILHDNGCLLLMRNWVELVGFAALMDSSQFLLVHATVTINKVSFVKCLLVAGPFCFKIYFDVSWCLHFIFISI